MITIDITAASNIGCVRHQNEDMILVGNHFVRNDVFCTRVDLTNQDRYIVAVADGMGGHNRATSPVAMYFITFSFITMTFQQDSAPVSLMKRWWNGWTA